MNTKNNIKAKITHQNIKNAFICLCQSKDAEKISIREICEKAGINRSSFYLHFEDIYALIDELLDDMICSIKVILAEGLKEGHKPLKEVFTDLIIYLRDNQSFLTSCFRGNRIPTEKLDITKEEPFNNEMMKYGRELGYTEKEVRLHFVFFASGFTALIEEWFKNGCKESPEYLSDFLYNEYHKHE